MYLTGDGGLPTAKHKRTNEHHSLARRKKGCFLARAYRVERLLTGRHALAGSGMAGAHVDQLGALDREEVQLALGRHCLGDQRLPCALADAARSGLHAWAHAMRHGRAVLAGGGAPVPGGPYSSTPERCLSPDANKCGCLSGSWIVSRIVRFTCALRCIACMGVAVRRKRTASADFTGAARRRTSSSPPTSAHLTFGTFGAPITDALCF